GRGAGDREIASRFAGIDDVVAGHVVDDRPRWPTGHDTDGVGSSSSGVAGEVYRNGADEVVAIRDFLAIEGDGPVALSVRGRDLGFAVPADHDGRSRFRGAFDGDRGRIGDAGFVGIDDVV